MQVLFPATATAKSGGHSEGDVPTEEAQNDDTLAFAEVFEEDVKAPSSDQTIASNELDALDDSITPRAESGDDNAEADGQTDTAGALPETEERNPARDVESEAANSPAAEEAIRRQETLAAHPQMAGHVAINQNKSRKSEEPAEVSGLKRTAPERSGHAERPSASGWPITNQARTHSIRSIGATPGRDGATQLRLPRHEASDPTQAMGTNVTSAKQTVRNMEGTTKSNISAPRHVLETVLSASAQSPVQKPIDVPRVLQRRAADGITFNTSVPAADKGVPEASTLAKQISNGDAPTATPVLLPASNDNSRVGTMAESATAPKGDATTLHASVPAVAGARVAALPSFAAVSRIVTSDSPLPLGDPTDTIVWELRPSHAPAAPASHNLAAGQIAPPRSDMPPQIAHNIAVAIQSAPGKPVEIALNPAELGRVRMMMTTSETGVVVHVVAERAETLDLMRRNIDDLGRALSELGYEDIAFAFGQNENAADQTPDDETEMTSVAVKIDTETDDVASPVIPTAPRIALMSGGVDLRL